MIEIPGFVIMFPEVWFVSPLWAKILYAFASVALAYLLTYWFYTYMYNWGAL